MQIENRCIEIGGNVTGNSPRQLASQFAVSRSLRPEIRRPVWHASLSLPVDDGFLSDERWQAIAHDFLTELGLSPDNHQHHICRHSDKPNDHIHIAVSRIGLDGTVWHGKWEARKAIILTGKLEGKYRLTRTKQWTKEDADVRSPSRAELNMGNSIRMLLQQRLTTASFDKPTMKIFLQRLENKGVYVCPAIAGNHRVYGISFSLTGKDGQWMKGSQLGKAYSWQGLQSKLGVNYEVSVT